MKSIIELNEQQAINHIRINERDSGNNGEMAEAC